MFNILFVKIFKYVNFFADINEGSILKLLENNINRNKSLVKYPISVNELNFYSESFHPDIKAALPDVKIILAADGNCSIRT